MLIPKITGQLETFNHQSVLNVRTCENINSCWNEVYETSAIVATSLIKILINGQPVDPILAKQPVNIITHCYITSKVDISSCIAAQLSTPQKYTLR